MSGTERRGVWENSLLWPPPPTGRSLPHKCDGMGGLSVHYLVISERATWVKRLHEFRKGSANNSTGPQEEHREVCASLPAASDSKRTFCLVLCATEVKPSISFPQDPHPNSLASWRLLGEGRWSSEQMRDVQPSLASLQGPPALLPQQRELMEHCQTSQEA